MEGAPSRAATKNPMAALLHAAAVNPDLYDALRDDPRSFIERFAIGVPDSIQFRCQDDGRHLTLIASVPRTEQGTQAMQQRMRRCPLAGITGDELAADPVAVLQSVGLRVPEDVGVEVDVHRGGFIHFTVVVARPSAQSAPP